MGRFTTRRRRATTADPGARGELSSQLRAALPPRFEAVGEALASGSGTIAACEVAGALLARDGLSLDEALDGLAATAGLVLGTDPEFAATRALTVAWSEAVLGYLHGLSCDDPLTGLSSLAHLRSRVSDAYRGEHRAGAPVSESHALVVVAAPPWPDAASGRDDVLTRAMRTAQLGDTARTVFAGPETIGHVAPGRVVVLAGRDERIGRRVGLLRRMLDGGAVPHTRVWIEGLPDSDEAAGRLLDELTRV
ncbi:hypothetical protein [Nocardioides sp. T2.26MG-1]|uniref:hypothetical protein n=1 Tax=Nocardioides sp. T2.26MG-1 TaxID=3041166 RepID=UPI002477B54B|nr:hypothetical protein [Nocardioides sp. T2.26MG-1]CAI9417502.1 hypothetical protein HIDPHFAB_03036 [Nocardioides sp. T2.26MG-1]